MVPGTAFASTRPKHLCFMRTNQLGEGTSQCNIPLRNRRWGGARNAPRSPEPTPARLDFTARFSALPKGCPEERAPLLPRPHPEGRPPGSRRPSPSPPRPPRGDHPARGRAAAASGSPAPAHRLSRAPPRAARGSARPPAPTLWSDPTWRR